MPMTAGTATGIWVKVWVMKPTKISTVIQQVTRSSGTLVSCAPVGAAAPAWSASAGGPMSLG